MLIDYLANRKLLNNNDAGKIYQKKNIFWSEMRGCGEKENIISGLLIILYFVFLFCPNPQSFDMR